MRASFQRLQESKQEQQADAEQERTVHEHPRVQLADSYDEVNVGNIDFNATEELVRDRFRAFFQTAQQGIHPWHSLALQFDILHLSPDEAIASVELRKATRKRFPSQTHSGAGFIKVANVNVAEFLIQASNIPELNCAPHGKNARPARVRRSSRKNQDRSSKKDEIRLAISGFELIDLDSSEGIEENTHHQTTKGSTWQYPVHRLWQTSLVKVLALLIVFTQSISMCLAADHAKS